MDNTNLINIESIIEAVLPMSKQVKDVRKFDGISMECTKLSTASLENAINEIKAICNKLKLLPVATEKRKDDAELFLVQFPELLPKYSDEEVAKMYTDTFIFLFNNIKMKDPSAATKSKLIEGMESLVKHAIKTYCRSNINQYKESFEDYYNDKKYRTKINVIFLDSVDTFITEV